MNTPRHLAVHPRAARLPQHRHCLPFAAGKDQHTTSQAQTLVIVSGGLAGATAAEALRAQGFTGAVVLLGEEAERPYTRPPLSQDYLQDRSELDKIFVHPPTWYAKHEVDLRLDTRVTAIDTVGHRVHTGSGERLVTDTIGALIAPPGRSTGPDSRIWTCRWATSSTATARQHDHDHRLGLEG